MNSTLSNVKHFLSNVALTVGQRVLYVNFDNTGALQFKQELAWHPRHNNLASLSSNEGFTEWSSTGISALLDYDTIVWDEAAGTGPYEATELAAIYAMLRDVKANHPNVLFLHIEVINEL